MQETTLAPRVSVVIKAYNHEAFVAQCLESVLGQSLGDIEVLITDDASTDRTAEVIRSFDDPRIDLRVAHKNLGISRSMNDLLSRARGDYVAILNSDDFAMPDRLRIQADFLDANPKVAAVFSRVKTVDDHSAPTPGFFDFETAFSLPNFSREAWLRHFFFKRNCLCAPSAMVRRVIYKRAGHYDPRLFNLQDFDMWVRVAQHGRLHVLDAELTAFRVRADHANASARTPENRRRTMFEFSKVLHRFREMDRDLLLRAFATELQATAISKDDPTDVILAELALTKPDSPAHRMFGLDLSYTAARTNQQLGRLKRRAGALDVFGLGDDE